MNQQLAEKSQQIIQTQIPKLHSSAFPDQKPVEEYSLFHEILRKADWVSDSFNLRPFHESDLYQLRNLQLQWFPLKYGDYFYHRLLRHQYQCVLAECSVRISGKIVQEMLQKEGEQFELKDEAQKKKNTFWHTRLQFFQSQGFFLGDEKFQEKIEIRIILGAIVFEFSQSRGYLSSSWWRENFLGQNNTTLYISTLGVIEQFRKKKIAHKLLQICVDTVDNNHDIKLILLHVIEYNEAAIRLYLRHEFQIFQKIEKFYHIEKQAFTGIVMGKFYNGGERRKNWSEWFRSLW